MTRRFTSYTSSVSLVAQRKRELGHIHQGKAALSWTDADYRYHLQQQTGKGSAADLDAAGRTTMLSHMAKLGFKPKSASFKPFGQPEKILWLWKQIGLAGGLRDASATALLAFVARTTGQSFSDVKFVPTLEANKIIEALKSMLDRAKRAQIANHGL